MGDGGWGIGLGFLRYEGDDGSPLLVYIYFTNYTNNTKETFWDNIMTLKLFY